MSSKYEYNKRVVGGGCFRQGMINEIISPGDSHPPDPKKWNMRCIALSGSVTFWEVGYIHRGTLAYQTNSAHTGFSPSYFFPRIMPPPKYWWCRDGDWLPYWGPATKQRATLMKELRTYWMNKWFGSQIPKIKQSIKENTNLPEDIIEDLSNYLEYPYQIKNV